MLQNWKLPKKLLKKRAQKLNEGNKQMENLDKDKNKVFLAVHGHFYQPPRENPWLEAIEQQDSALPFHDWNERINGGC